MRYPWRKLNGDASIPSASARYREMDLKTLEKQALRLSAEDRAALAQKLLLSLEDMPASELDEMWLLEAERRARQLDRGEVQPVSADEVRRKAKALLR